MYDIKPEERVPGYPEDLGLFAQCRLDQMEEEKPRLVKALARAGYLIPYLERFGQRVSDMYGSILRSGSLQDSYGVNDELKEQDPMQWKQRKNMVEAIARDMALRECLGWGFPPMPTKEEQNYLRPVKLPLNFDAT